MGILIPPHCTSMKIKGIKCPAWWLAKNVCLLRDCQHSHFNSYKINRGHQMGKHFPDPTCDVGCGIAPFAGRRSPWTRLWAVDMLQWGCAASAGCPALSWASCSPARLSLFILFCPFPPGSISNSSAKLFEVPDTW